MQVEIVNDDMKCLICKKKRTAWEIENHVPFLHLKKICGDCYVKTSDHTKLERNDISWSRHQKAELEAHAKDVVQPLKNGVINKKFIQAYGTKTLEKETN